MQSERHGNAQGFSWKLMLLSALVLYLPYFVMAAEFHDGRHANTILALTPLAPGFCGGCLAGQMTSPNPSKSVIFITSGVLTGILHLAIGLALRASRKAWVVTLLIATAVNALSFWGFYQVMSW